MSFDLSQLVNLRHIPSSSIQPPQGFSPLSISLTEDPAALTVPLSISLTEDPAALTVYVADVWSSPPSSGGWLGGVAMTEAELQQALAQLPPPLVPTFLKAYTVGYQVFYAYIARATSSSPPRSTLTTDVSRSAFELLARSLKQPPLLVSSYGPLDGGAQESDAPGSGERYAVLWQTDGLGIEERAGESAGLAY
ncbi:unnamed protein product [Closterium sp. Yama58-4]|nr:unnamed protein product [Closterium sp. Yama58-4]